MSIRFSQDPLAPCSPAFAHQPLPPSPPYHSYSTISAVHLLLGHPHVLLFSLPPFLLSFLPLFLYPFFLPLHISCHAFLNPSFSHALPSPVNPHPSFLPSSLTHVLLSLPFPLLSPSISLLSSFPLLSFTSSFAPFLPSFVPLPPCSLRGFPCLRNTLSSGVAGGHVRHNTCSTSCITSTYPAPPSLSLFLFLSRFKGRKSGKHEVKTQDNEERTKMTGDKREKIREWVKKKRGEIMRGCSW